MPALHQWVAGFSSGDAISNEALLLRTLFRSWGFTSDIFCEGRRILPALRHEARDVNEYVPLARPDDIVLLHLSVGSPLNELFARLPVRKALLYHNITPPSYFRLVSPYTAHWLSVGLQQAKALAGVATVNLADSRFNARELEDFGYPPVAVFPLFLNLPPAPPPRPRPACENHKKGLSILFVGRCAPNKKIDDLVLAFGWFQKYVEPHSHLVHIGSFTGMERYRTLIQSMVCEMQLDGVEFTGNVSQAQLNRRYAEADLFLCLSDHEGFCIPLLEAMRNDIPVLALARSAIPETLDGAGVLFQDRDFALIAETMGRVARDPVLRLAILEGQRARINRYLQRDFGAELRAHLAPLL
jgi:glycosyltransferase involved in cell wall biosynthesis